MNFQLFGNKEAPTLLLIPGLGVSYEIFLPLIRLTEEKFRIIAVEVGGFTLGKHTRFTSVDDQAAQVIAYIKAHFDASQIAYVTLDKGLLDADYDVKFNDGRSLEFNKAGELTKVDRNQTEVPSALIPEAVCAHVKANFPNAFITEWSKDDRRWKAELNSGLDLEFNSKYEFVRIDD